MPNSIFPLSIIIRSIRPCQFSLSVKFIIIIVKSFISGICNRLIKFRITLMLLFKIWIIILYDIRIDFRRLTLLLVILRHKFFLIFTNFVVKILRLNTVLIHFLIRNCYRTIFNNNFPIIIMTFFNILYLVSFIRTFFNI